MLTYKAAYKWADGIVLGEVLDFPGTVSFGHTIDEARSNLAGALQDMAETNLLFPRLRTECERWQERGRNRF